MNEAIAQLPWTDRQWDLVQQAVKQEAERTRIPAKFLRTAKADPADMAVPAYALDTAALPLATDPIANQVLRDALAAAGGAVAAAVAQSLRPDVNSEPTVYLTSISKLIYLRNRELADPNMEAALTYFRRAGALVTQAENALLLNGRNLAGAIRRAPADITVNQIPNTPRGLLDPTTPPDFRVEQPDPAAVDAAGELAAFGGRLVRAVSDATAQLEAVPYHAPYAMVASTNVWRVLNQPAAQSLVPARPAIERALMGGPLLQSSLLPAGWAFVVPHDCPELEQVVAREIGVKFLQMSEEPRAIFRVSVRTALRVRDWSAIASIRMF